MTATKKHQGRAHERNTMWKILNDPHFVQKCAARDPKLVEHLHSLSALSRENLGKMALGAFDHTSDVKAGKFIKSLMEAMTEQAVGEIMFAVFSQCELPNA